MRVEIERPRPLHPIGLATFTLTEVKVVPMPSFNDPSQTVDRWIWIFESSKKTEDGDPYQVSIATGQRYGNSQAKLTWLLDLIFPGITIREAERLDTDEMIGMNFEGSVKHEQARNDPEKKIATFAYLKPIPAEGAEADPFAFDQDGAVQVCSECGVEVDDSIAKHSLKRWGIVLCHPHGRARIKAAEETASPFVVEPAAV